MAEGIARESSEVNAGANNANKNQEGRDARCGGVGFQRGGCAVKGAANGWLRAQRSGARMGACGIHLELDVLARPFFQLGKGFAVVSFVFHNLNNTAK